MKLNDWMKKTGKTPEDIAYELKIARATVFYWLAKNFKPSFENLSKLSKLTGLKFTKEDF